MKDQNGCPKKPLWGTENAGTRGYGGEVNDQETVQSKQTG